MFSRLFYSKTTLLLAVFVGLTLASITFGYVCFQKQSQQLQAANLLITIGDKAYNHGFLNIADI